MLQIRRLFRVGAIVAGCAFAGPQAAGLAASNQDYAGAVIDGVPAEPAQYREVVAVGSASGFHCTGVLVAPSLVLTARHCLPATRVLFGTTITAPQDLIAVEHSEGAADDQLDAALLHLAVPAAVAPARLSLDRSDAPPRGIVRMVGFGTTDPTGHVGFGRKRYADVSASGWGCELQRRRTLGCDPQRELVLFRAGRKDTCDGDSGGPIYTADGTTSRVLAITSRAIGVSSNRCGQGGIYLRIDALASWLRASLAKPSANSVKKEHP